MDGNMIENPIEQEPGRRQKVERYKTLRRAQRTTERVLLSVPLENAIDGATKPLITTKDRLEQAAGIIKNDLQGEKEGPEKA